MSVIGLSMNHLFDLMQKRFEKTIIDKLRVWYGRLNRVWDWITEVRTKKPAEVTAEIIGSAKGFAKSILDGIVVWIVEKVSTGACGNGCSLAASAGLSEALDAIRRIYRAIKTAVRWMRTILEMVNQALDSVMNIAAGTIGPAATMLENAMKRATPAVIGFLGDQVGLGGIADKIREIIDDLREKIDEAILGIFDQRILCNSCGRALARQGRAKYLRKTCARYAWIFLRKELRDDHTREEARKVIQDVAERLRPAGLRSLVFEPEDASGTSQIIAESSPARPLAKLVRAAEAPSGRSVIVEAKITLDSPHAVSSGTFAPANQGAVTKTGEGYLPYSSRKNYRSSPGILPTRSTFRQDAGNATHAEFQFYCPCIQNQGEDFKAKIKTLELNIDPFSPCAACCGLLIGLLRTIKQSRKTVGRPALHPGQC